jgi:outer membrane protein insertion porin family
MPDRITITPIRNLPWQMILGVFLLMASGCKVTKNYPANKAFVYNTNFKIDTKLPQTEKQDLLAKIQNQVDDSLKVNWTSKLFIRKILNKPPVFDTLHATRSIKYINDLLYANGYLYSSASWDSSLATMGDEQRVTVNFSVVTGKVLRIDSTAFSFRDSILQSLAASNKNNSIIIKGEPYTKDKISREIDRLLVIYRNNGYLKINRDDIYAEVDTVVAALIDPGLDPFEQIRLLEEVQKRRENPKINVVFKQRGNETAEHLQQFTIRNVKIFPERSIGQDTVRFADTAVSNNSITIFSSRNLFKPSFLLRNNYLKPGALYRQEDVYRTNNAFGQMGAWSQVGIDVFPIDSVAKLDAHINMYPAKKQYLNVDLEASSNSADVAPTTSSSNLFGLAVNFGIRNRNVNKQSILSTTNLRFGIELGNKATIIQTYQTSLSQNYSIPKFVLPFKIRAEKHLLTSRTNLNASAYYTIRRKFLTVQGLNTSIGYEWTNKKNRTWFYSPLNIEFLRKIGTDSFTNTFKYFPNYRYLFNDGLIISQYLRLNTGWAKSNKAFNIRMQAEESGALFGNIKSLDLKNLLSRFVKADIDLRYYINYPRHTWAFRLFGGLGVPYGKQLDSMGNVQRELTLPWFKSYSAGGPLSMRAWQIRQLGPGSYLINDSISPDRFGDVQLEANIEYRFSLGTLFGIKVKSAFFTDMGNIWYRNNQGNPKLDAAVFKLNKLYKDLAVAGGTSLRFDFNYFLIRFDWAYKLKNPIYADTNSGWFQNIKLRKGQFQLGINYPF